MMQPALKVHQMKNRPEYIQRKARERLMKEAEEKEEEEPEAKKKKVIVPEEALSEKAVLPGISSPTVIPLPKEKVPLVRLQPVTDFRKKEPPPPRRETRGITHTSGPTTSLTRLSKGLR